MCGECVGQQEVTHLNLILVKAYRDTPSCSGEEGGHANPYHSQRGKLEVGKGWLKSSRAQSAPVGKRDKREGSGWAVCLPPNTGGCRGIGKGLVHGASHNEGTQPQLETPQGQGRD